jgi:hypothetical protein
MFILIFNTPNTLGKLDQIQLILYSRYPREKYLNAFLSGDLNISFETSEFESVHTKT